MPQGKRRPPLTTATPSPADTPPSVPDPVLTDEAASTTPTEATPTPSNVRTISLVETEGMTAAAMAKRRKASVERLDEVLGKLQRNHVQVDAYTIQQDAQKMLHQSLMMEECRCGCGQKRITEDEVVARLNEYMLLYLDNAWANHVRLATQRELEGGPDAARRTAGSVGMAGRGSPRRIAAGKSGLWTPPQGAGRRVQVVDTAAIEKVG